LEERLLLPFFCFPFKLLDNLLRQGSVEIVSDGDGVSIHSEFPLRFAERSQGLCLTPVRLFFREGIVN
jgi:hypothetical protein